MNKKGYTLIELLSVFVVLTMILGMIVVSVVYFSNEQRNKDYNNMVTIIQKNTDILVNTNDTVYEKVNDKLSTIDTCKIYYQELINNDLMDQDTINPKTNNTMNLESYIKVTVDSNYDFKYEFVDKDIVTSNEGIENCLE